MASPTACGWRLDRLEPLAPISWTTGVAARRHRLVGRRFAARRFAASYKWGYKREGARSTPQTHLSAVPRLLQACGSGPRATAAPYVVLLQSSLACRTLRRAGACSSGREGAFSPHCGFEFDIAERRVHNCQVKSSQVFSSPPTPFHHCWPPEHIRQASVWVSTVWVSVVEKFVFCLTGPYLTKRSTIGRLEPPLGRGRFV